MPKLRTALTHAFLGIQPYPSLRQSETTNFSEKKPTRSAQPASLQKSHPPAQERPTTTTPTKPIPKPDTPPKAKTLESLRTQLLQLESPLNTPLTKCIFADGSPGSILVLGEAPGAQEEIEGKPFVGQTGKLLMKMFEQIGLTREKLYITNISPWRPPGNRTPTSQEIATLRPFVHQHIKLSNPPAVIAVGATPLQALFGNNVGGISKVRGSWQKFTIDGKSFPTIALFHPAYLLRNPAKKKEAWFDLITIERFLNDN